MDNKKPKIISIGILIICHFILKKLKRYSKLNYISLDDLLAHKRITTVLIPEPIIPAINASKKNLDNILGIKGLKKLTMKGKIK